MNRMHGIEGPTGTARRPTLLIADDHRIVAEGFARLFAERFEILGIAGDGLEMISMHDAARPDLVVTDISMPRLGGIEAARRILERHPEARIAVLSMHEQPEHLRAARAIGLRGVLSKTSPPRTVLAALDAIAHGGTVFPETGSPTPPLSSRQREVVAHLAMGLSLAETAEAIGVTAKTVEYHKYRTMRMLGLRTSGALVRFAVESGLVDARDPKLR